MFISFCELLKHSVGYEAVSSKIPQPAGVSECKSASKWRLLFAEITDRVDKLYSQNALAFGLWLTLISPHCCYFMSV